MVPVLVAAEGVDPTRPAPPVALPVPVPRGAGGSGSGAECRRRRGSGGPAADGSGSLSYACRAEYRRRASARGWALGRGWTRSSESETGARAGREGQEPGRDRGVKAGAGVSAWSLGPPGLACPTRRAVAHLRGRCRLSRPRTAGPSGSPVTKCRGVPGTVCRLIPCPSPTRVRSSLVSVGHVVTSLLRYLRVQIMFYLCNF